MKGTIVVEEKGEVFEETVKIFEGMASGGFTMLVVFFALIMAFLFVWSYLTLSHERKRRL